MATAGTGTMRDGQPIAGGGWGRIGGVLRHPHHGWRAVAASQTSAGALLLGVATPLTAIGPIARLIRALAFGSGSMGIIQYRITTNGAILTALVGWAAALAAVWLLSVAIDRSAPWFGGLRDRRAATAAAVFGSSAWWLASGFAVLPALGFLQLLGLYSLVLLFVGTPLLMRPREERTSLQGLSVMAAAVALLIASLAIADAVATRSLQPTVRTAAGRVVVTGAPAIAGSRLVAPAADKSRAVAPGTAAAAAAGQSVVPASSLQALLPAQIGLFVRTTLESQSNLAAGIASSDAKATYVHDTNSFTLTIADAGAPGALATNNSVIAGEVNRVTDSGYQRSRVVGGVRITEKWSNASHGGSYSRAVAGRFTVEAQGTAPAIDTLRAAVAAIDQSRLVALDR
ncbi:YIP1 family protein [Sphingomonas bacterium]|uniref:YIP1 family protein n=1 Tax=Sphingomonas bacterium TaxID=1895847 RepID=UPI00157747D0|nr:YIP1 family protein [Sphingomonas bacterium]